MLVRTAVVAVRDCGYDMQVGMAGRELVQFLQIGTRLWVPVGIEEAY